MIGIYFLLKGDVVVYVGQSMNVEKRVTAHRDKDFDSFRVIPCEPSKLLHYEKRLIKYFKPMYNGETGGKRPGAGRPKLKDSEKKKSKVMRIPDDKIESVKKLLENDK